MDINSAIARDAVQPFIARIDKHSAASVVGDYLDRDIMRLDGRDILDYADGEMWSDEVERGISRKAHGWFFLRYWYSAWPLLEEKDRQRLTNRMSQLLSVWLNYRNAGSAMAFHDEATAQRVINFVKFLDVAMKDISDSLIHELRLLIDEETQLLASDDFYAGSNNHGMFQDIAVLVSTAYGHCEKSAELLDQKVIERLLDYLQASFTSDGIHTENSPTYHLMVSRYLSLIMKYCGAVGFEDFPESVHRVLEDADRYSAFALNPGNSFVPISDSQRGPVSVASVEDAFGQGLTTGVLTGGERGHFPKGKTFVAEETGYGVYRSDWSSDANYVFFSSAYNANYHKHSDEGSLYYYSHGREILVEAGPNGYQYNDPLTKYAYSSAAHNSMLVDGNGLPRIDAKSNLTTLSDVGTSLGALKVEGRTQRYEGVDWRRTVNVPADKNGELVRVSDFVNSEIERTFTFLWHLGDGLTALARGNAIEVFDISTDAKVAEVLISGSPISSISTKRGIRHPYHQGWSFPQMGSAVPSDTVEVELRGRTINLEWEIRSDDFLLIDRGVTPSSAWQVYEAEKPVHYLLEGLREDGTAESLIVAFTAMGQHYDFTYNYKSALEGFTGAKLFIIDDFGDQGSYYLASGRNLVEFRSVQSLIRTIIDRIGVSTTDVITLGSSKGGTAALLHGVAIGVGQVYAGAPQYRIGDFVRVPHPNVLEYVAGGTSESDVSWLNDIPRRLLASGVKSTKVTVIVGREDGHFRHHTVPLVDELRMLGYRTEHLHVPGTVHSELGGVFRGFVSSMVQAKSNDQTVRFPNTLAYDPKKKLLGLVVSGADERLMLAQLFRGSEKFGKLVRVKNGLVSWSNVDEGDYRARIYFDTDEGSRQVFASTSCRARKVRN